MSSINALCTIVGRGSALGRAHTSYGYGFVVSASGRIVRWRTTSRLHSPMDPAPSPWSLPCVCAHVRCTYVDIYRQAARCTACMHDRRISTSRPVYRYVSSSRHQARTYGPRPRAARDGYARPAGPRREICSDPPATCTSRSRMNARVGRAGRYVRTAGTRGGRREPAVRRRDGRPAARPAPACTSVRAVERSRRPVIVVPCSAAPRLATAQPPPHRRRRRRTHVRILSCRSETDGSVPVRAVCVCSCALQLRPVRTYSAVGVS